MAPNFIRRWLGGFKAAEERASIYSPGQGWALGSGGPWIDAAVAEGLATVQACVSAISSAIASMPARVYRAADGGAGRVEAPTHPVARLIRAPNQNQSWPDFSEWLLSQALLHGNALAAIGYDGAGRPTTLTPIPWNYVQPSVLASGRLVFDVVQYSTPFGAVGVPRRIFADECFYLRDRSDDGWLGRSRISRGAAVLQAAAGLQEYSGAIWQNAATPSGVVELPAGVTPDGVKRVQAWFTDQYAGAANGKKMLFADPGTKFTPISVSPEDAEILASRRFSGEEIARLFGVPPPIVGDYTHGTFTNSAQAGLWFAQHTLTPWVRKIEAEAARVLFSGSDAHLEIDLSGLLRGDPATRWASNVAAVNAGILTPNEVREAEGWNPRPDGDSLKTPAPATAALEPGAGA